MSVPFRHRVEYVAFRVGVGCLRLLPERWALWCGGMLGLLAGTVFRIRRAVTDENLERAFPDRDRHWRDRVARASYRNIGREGVAAFLLGGASVEEVRRRTPDPIGIEVVLDALAKGRGAIIVTGHLGNWEMAGAAAAARGIPLDAVAVRQSNRLFDEALVENRSKLGIRVIHRGDAPREVIRSLRAGRVPALVADQDAGRAGLFADFLGTPASTARGPAVFSLRAGVPLFLGVCVPDPQRSGRYLCEVEEIQFEPTGNREEDVVRLTEAHVSALAAHVRQWPEHYFWQHRRWRTVAGRVPQSEPRDQSNATGRTARGTGR